MPGNLLAVLAAASVVAGCGGSPSSPSPGSSTTNQASEAAVMSAMSQAMRQIAITPVPGGGTSNTFTMPCEGGGSIVMTMGPVSPPEGNVFRSSSRIEYRDCRHQAVTINGDPWLDMSSEFLLPAPGGASQEFSSTSRMTGGMRFNNGGVLGRVQFNCTMLTTVRLVTGSQPEVSVTASGTTTFEQPLGSPPVVRPCGPS